MYQYYDYHVHSGFSADSSAKMADMVLAGIRAGLKEIAITDHYDPDYCDPTWPSYLPFEEYQKEMEKTKQEFSEQIFLVRGLEMGVQHGQTIEKCRNTAAAYDYDFLLASFHCAEGYELSCGGYFDQRSMEETFASFYRYVYDCLKEFKDYCVLGHINVVDRYGKYVPKPSTYMDIVEEIFKLIIQDGRGIEINTSSFRYGMGERTTPSAEMLTLYKDLGGEIVTVGSDAHFPEHVGAQLNWAYDKMKDVGFRYVTTFRQRQPVFNKL